MEDLKKRHPDVEPFLLRKWERIFNTFFDQNATHEVDRGDFYIVIKHVRDIYGAESDQMVYAKKSLNALWEGMLALCDKNQDDKIQIDEWVEVLKDAHKKKDNLPKWFTDYMTFIFKLFDVSADDKIDVSEYQDGMHAYGLTETQAKTAFNVFAEKRQPVGFKQFQTLWNEFFFSNKKMERGNNLFGVLDSESGA